MTRPEKAEALFRSGYNCAQSVVMAFAPDFGLTQEEAERISAAFGGGFSRLRETCGTVSGAAMVLSLRYGAGTGSDREKKTRLYTTVQDFAKAFAAQHGSYICRELLALGPGPDSPVPEARTGRVLQPPPLRKICACGRRAARTLFIAAFGFPSRKRRGNPGGDAAALRHSEGAKRPAALPRLLAALRPARRFQKTSPPHKAGGVLTE